MRISNLLLAGVGLVTFSGVAARGDTLASWTFESPNTPADLSDSATGPSVAPAAGSGTFKGVHASALSDWTTPAGPGSANAYSATNWAAGDYFEFSTSSTGFENLVVSFDATGSNTGPRDFKIAYSTDGSAFTDFGTYSLINAGWSASSPPSDPNTSHFVFDFSGVPVLDNDSSVFFRLIQVGTVSINAGTVAAAGTSRVDNVTVEASAIGAPVPLPTAALAGGTLLGMLGATRRRRPT